MSFASWSEKNVGTIALVVALVALVSSIAGYCRICWNEAEDDAEFVAVCYGGGPGIGAESGALLNRLGEQVALCDARLALAAEAVKSGVEHMDVLLERRLDADLARLELLRAKYGKWGKARVGAAEAYLKARVAHAKVLLREGERKSGALTEAALLEAKLAANRADVELHRALRWVRDRGAFHDAVQPFEQYPQRGVAPEAIVVLFNAEQSPGGDGSEHADGAAAPAADED